MVMMLIGSKRNSSLYYHKLKVNITTQPYSPQQSSRADQTPLCYIAVAKIELAGICPASFRTVFRVQLRDQPICSRIRSGFVDNLLAVLDQIRVTELCGDMPILFNPITTLRCQGKSPCEMIACVQKSLVSVLTSPPDSVQRLM
jgi:hypothetical protein